MICVYCVKVSLEEAMAYLDNQESVDVDVFRDSVWSFVSDKITFDLPETEPPSAPAPPTEAPPPDDLEDYDDYDDYG